MSVEAQEFEKAVFGTLEAAGGVNLVRKYSDKPADRSGDMVSLLESLGVWELRPHESVEELEAAAVACRAAGAVALPYPIAERLARPDDRDGAILVQESGARMAGHGDLAAGWVAYDLLGNRYDVLSADAGPLGTLLAPFAGEVVVSEPTPGYEGAAALLVTLQSWWLLGLLERALGDTIKYAGEREQFGRKLTGFQTASFRLADMQVSVHKLEELAKYTLWSLTQNHGRSTALVDALALRAASLESADIVMRGAHQLHGAMGFCDETDVSWLSRVSQAVRRLPAGRSQTVELLTRRTLETGFEGLFSELQEF
ncbi:acyl-CoA dehydrogenase family protein [Nocardia sp. NPDC050378]|uniref:acyl-CoA dehydrogenase family protein n=1 Tax=Nocardia sp. NPDC050378 TaxID=3155400 RepID=UPI0033F323D9